MRVLFALAAASTASAALVQRPELALGWTDSTTNLVGESVAPTDDFSFYFLVKDQNMDELRQYVANISDPDHSMYGQGMTNTEVSEFTKPSAEDTQTITNWLDSEDGCTYKADSAGRRITVTCSVEAAERLLSTKIGHLVNRAFKQQVVRASDYELPEEVDAAAATVFGLHGLPLPPRSPLLGAPSEPADVTPAVIHTTYSVSGVTPKGTTTNRMAVAEFQGQNEEDSDLAAFFQKFVPDAQEGDDKIYKFVGDKDKQQPGVEASLDIQYIMGVAPHIKSEFWLYDPMDFCGDLETWTAEILKEGTEGPRIHSVSYGWQGNLTQVQCTADKYNTVDANFAKIAATRSTIIFASGDSGSGYAPPQPNCNAATKGVQYKGTTKTTTTSYSPESCCFEAAQFPDAAGYSFLPNSGPSPGPTCQGGDIGTKDETYTGKPVEVLKLSKQELEVCCEIGRGHYFSAVPNADAATYNCSIYDEVTGTTKSKGAYRGKPSNPQAGKCTIYEKISGTIVNKNATSGSAPPAGSVTLWPSWPASSPYVTSVGATRFVDQKVGQPEMATDQFGSGGGFSAMFDQTHATWQTAAVKQYTDNPPADPHYPPAGSFPVNGRATPDICALGEGYQVFTGGQVQPVGGTSASTPAFAGMLALINEALEQAGKPSVGFVNPLLYKNADCFTDVTRGTNAIGRGTGPIKYGFNATAGWDPATGLGSPIFDKLLKAVLDAAN